MTRFLLFLKQVRSSMKVNFLDTIQYDTGSVTGLNLRRNMLLLGKDSVKDIEIEMVKNMSYENMSADNTWRPKFVREIIDVKHDNLKVEGFDE